MRIYKFKDLRDKSAHHHLLQIIDENKVWCAAADTLNDEKEFDFQMDYCPTRETANLLAKVINKLGTSAFPPSMTASYALSSDNLEQITKPLVVDIVNRCRSTIGVTSFSTTSSEDQLWNEYGGQGNGAVVEFELSDQSIGETFHFVDYVPNNIFHVDVFLKSRIGESKQQFRNILFRNMLCTKTSRWQHEREIRFLGRTQNVNIRFEAPVMSLVIGKDVSVCLAEKLSHCCQKRGVKVDRQD